LCYALLVRWKEFRIRPLKITEFFIQIQQPPCHNVKKQQGGKNMLNHKKTIPIFDLTGPQVDEIQEKYALLEPLLSSYLSPAEKRRHRIKVCQILQVSDRTLRRYLHKVKKQGIKVLARPVRSDAGKYRKFSQRLLDKALLLLKQNPYRSIAMLMGLLKADPELKAEAEKIKPATLYHHLKKTGFDFKHRNGPDKDVKVYHLFEAEYPNKLWQGDARHGIYLPNPRSPKKTKKTYLFAWIDDFSRKIMYARYYWDEKLPRLEHCFKHAVLSWTIPEMLYCDNGRTYTSKKFLLIVSGLHIKKIHHPAYSAWCKGKVENVMKSFKRFQREAQLAGFKTLEELNTALFAWIDVEYNNKVHSSTGETPNNRFRNNLKPEKIRRVTDLQEFEMLFLGKKTTKINKFGKIRFNNNEYKVKGLTPHTEVVLRYDPFDLSWVLLFHKEQLYCKLSASILRSKTMPNVPQESNKPEKTVSKESVNYFKMLREKHAENQKKSYARISYASLAKEKNQEENK
jgi:putative transposase